MVIAFRAAFFASGDFLFGGFIDDLGRMVDDGVKVALIYGDRDYRCNCELSHFSR